jgi:hypothetical protein
LKVYNLAALTTSNQYMIRVRILSSLTSGANFQPSVVIQTHYTINADPSIVDQSNSFSLSALFVNYYTSPNQFQINNPRIAFESATVGYIGKF